MAANIITRYDYQKRAENAPGVAFDVKKDKSLTNQADMESADINKIMARYEKTGVLIDPSGTERKPMYGDFTLYKDYHSLLVGLRNVDRAFGLLPAKIRNRFDNDPQKLINFLDDPANDKEAIELGLKEAPPKPAPTAEALAAAEAAKLPGQKIGVPAAPAPPGAPAPPTP